MISKKTQAARTKMENAERDRYIAILGMAPEIRTSRDERYAATTGELFAYVVEAHGLTAAETIRNSFR